MTVCDICMKPDPVFSGTPYIRRGGGNETYLFDKPHHRIDLCDECRALLGSRAWDKIAEKAHDVLLLRLGVSEPPTPN